MRSLTFVNGGGVSTVLSQRPYLITKLEGIDLPNVREQTQVAPYQDGDTFIDSVYDHRVIVIEGAFPLAGGDLADIATARRTFSALFNPKLGEGTITFQNDSYTRYASATVGGLKFKDKPSRAPFQEFQLTLICHDPYWYGAEQTVTVTGSNTWAARTMSSSMDLRAIAYGNGVFVAVDNGSDTAAVSVDGVSWTEYAMPASGAGGWRSIAFGNGVFVATGYNTALAATSTDGTSWTARTMPSTRNWQGIAYGAGLFVALGSGSTVAATSPDGITWTARVLPSSSAWISVAYGNSVFVAIASGGTVAATSYDGITWTARTLPASLSWYSIAFGNGVFVAIADSSATCAVSSDGITWTTGTMPSAGSWICLFFGGGLFLAIGDATISANSFNGISWTARTLPSSSTWTACAYGDGIFVAVASGSTAAATFLGSSVPDLTIDTEADTPCEITIVGSVESPIMMINDESFMVTKTLAAGESIVMDTTFGRKAVKYITSGGYEYNAMQYLSGNSKFPQLKDGVNTITFLGASATIKYRERTCAL